jgi:hypothetical protein
MPPVLDAGATRPAVDAWAAERDRLLDVAERMATQLAAIIRLLRAP